MARLVCLMLLATILSMRGHRAEAQADLSQSKGRVMSAMPEETATRALFDRWERVWNLNDNDLIPQCIGETYIRHDENGDRTVTRDAYAAEIAKLKVERPGIQVLVYDHGFKRDRAWFRFAFKWTDTKTGRPQSRAGMQSYRIQDGKLVETWIAMQPLGSTWTDPPQAHWTTAPSIN